jgi:hypothetical protein
MGVSLYLDAWLLPAGETPRFAPVTSDPECDNYECHYISRIGV